MVDEGVIRNRLKHLDEYILDLEEEKHLAWEDFLKSKKTRRYIERTLHLAIECCLDVGHHIIAEERLREPRDSKDVFSVLNEEGYLRRSDVTRLMQMAGFRNIIVHDYTRIDRGPVPPCCPCASIIVHDYTRIYPAIVYSILKKGIPDLVNFSLDIKESILAEKAE